MSLKLFFGSLFKWDLPDKSGTVALIDDVTDSILTTSAQVMGNGTTEVQLPETIGASTVDMVVMGGNVYRVAPNNIPSSTQYYVGFTPFSGTISFQLPFSQPVWCKYKPGTFIPGDNTWIDTNAWNDSTLWVD